MSLKIKKLTGEIFDLPPDYIIEAEKINPLFTNKGSKTVPIHFPNTDNNRKLLLNSDRLDRLSRPDETFEVVVETDSSQQSGLMAINSGFNAGIGFDESEMYNKMNSMQLRDISDLPSLTLHGNTTDAKITSMLNHLTAVMKEQVTTDYFVFAVILNVETKEGEYGRRYFDIINEIDLLYPSGVVELAALEARQIYRYIDGEEVIIQAPKGYGVSPFIKVYRVLELIFKNWGFSILENPFKEHRQLKKLVVLNNTIDAIMTGTLYYKDMMPDITIKQFLDGLFNKFGMVYFLNSNSKTVQIKFLKDLMTPLKLGSINLDKFKTEEPIASYSPAKQIKLLMNRQLEGSEVLADTYEEFLEKYNYEFADRGSSDAYNSTNLFNPEKSRYTLYSALQSKTLVSSDFFDYYKKSDLEYVEIKMEDLCLPFSTETPNEASYLYYGVNFKNAYTEIIVGAEKVGEVQNPALLAFAFGFGTVTVGRIWNCFFASQINRDPDGNFIIDENGEKYDISLTCNREDGLFNRFWKEYDAFLRHSNFEVKCKLKLSDMDIFNFDMFKTAIINNQPLLPKQIKYKLNQENGICECSFQTLRLYEPYDLAEEQKIPTYAPQKYYWKSTQRDTVNYENVNVAWLLENDYTIPDYNGWGKFPDTVDVDGQSVPSSQLFLFPPTEEQFRNQTTIQFSYSWTARNPTPPFPYPWQITGTTHVTMKPELR